MYLPRQGSVYGIHTHVTHFRRRQRSASLVLSESIAGSSASKELLSISPIQHRIRCMHFVEQERHKSTNLITMGDFLTASNGDSPRVLVGAM